MSLRGTGMFRKLQPFPEQGLETRPPDPRIELMMSATSPSLHIGLNVDLPGSQDRGPYAPDLPRVDPRVLFGGGGETDVCKDIDDRLAVARCRLAIGRQGNPM